MNNMKIICFSIMCAFLWNNFVLSSDERQVSASELMQKIRESDQMTKADAELFSLPNPTGPYQVGVVACDLFDPSRKSLEHANGRLVPIWVYFPMQKGENESYPKPLEERLSDGFRSIPVWKQLCVKVHSKRLKTIEGLARDTFYPVVIFNHGNSMHMGDFGFIVEELASHGYVVITIQHQLASDEKRPRYLGGRDFDNYALVIRNDFFVFDWLQDHNKDVFHNSLDLKRTGLMGYSMGAHALMCLAQHAFYSYKNAHLLPHRDKEGVRECFVTLDSQRIPFPHHSSCPLFMLMGGDREASDRESGETADMVRFHHRFCYYKGASHSSFTDYAYLNIHEPATPDQVWFHGTAEERMLFFKKVRADILSFLHDALGPDDVSKKDKKEISMHEGTRKFYESGIERERLEKGTGQLEKVRTEKILDQFLPKPPAVVLDVGGGIGVYAFDLAKKGYDVYLIDPVVFNIEEAKKTGEAMSENGLRGYVVGDARKIEMKDQSADVVLFFGPLYHLDHADRRIALLEAHRVLKSGGKLFAVGISKCGPLTAFFNKGKMTSEIKRAVFESLSKGQFKYCGALFYSQYPNELTKEIEESGFQKICVRPIEGVGSLLTDENIENEQILKDFLQIVDETQEENSILGVSDHFMVIGQK